jgi:CheY-like chemotaxis protein
VLPFRTRIVTRLSAAFAILLLLTVVMAGLALRTIMVQSDLANDLYSHPFTVSRAILTVRVQVTAIQGAMTALVHARSQTEIDRLATDIAGYEADALSQMDTVHARFLGRSEDVEDILRQLARWRSARDQTIQLMRNGRAAEALARFVGEDGAILKEVETEVEEVRAFSAAKASTFTQSIDDERDSAMGRLLTALAGLVIVGALLSRLMTRGIVTPLHDLRVCMETLSRGDLTAEVPERFNVAEVTAMAGALQVLKDSAVHLDQQRWIKECVGRVSTTVQQADSLGGFGRRAVEAIAPMLGAGVAVFYLRHEESERFDQLAGYGTRDLRSGTASFTAGEGLTGQCIISQATIVLRDLPENYIRISSGTGEAPPRMAMAVPLVLRGKVLAVLELASFVPFTTVQMELLEELRPTLSMTLEILQRNLRTRHLLDMTQQQADELSASEEELRAQSDALQSANEELRLKSETLQQQSEELRVSEEELKAQHDALQVANEELTEKTRILEERGFALEVARREADQRAIDLDMASRYKSEFLANMSHELRTPLNSLLILSKSIADNDEGNLTADQIESAHIVHESGNHLLALINDILDLSKVEAGKMQVKPSEFDLEAFAAAIRRRFAPMAAEKDLGLSVTIATGLPATIISDRGKLEQIANNLVGNAVKFTAAGRVTVEMGPPSVSPAFTATGLDPTATLAVVVTDTGIGIDPQHYDRIFRAFEQVDGSASRQFGGTGLGLAISRQLAQLLGGDIIVASEPERGSTFTLLVPLSQPATEQRVTTAPPPPPAAVAALPRADSGHDLILVIEDDPVFARIVCDLARARGFRTLTATDGAAGIEMARLHHPTGIVLDLGLPLMDGWAVMARLKASPETKGIPIHVVSATEDNAHGLEAGAIGFLTKPASRQQIESVFTRILDVAAARRLLVVDDDATTREAVTRLLKTMPVEVVTCADGQQALEHLRVGNFDCLVLDLMMPDMSGLDLLRQAAKEKLALPPVIVYSAAELSAEQTLGLQEFTDSIVIKGARSPERLLDEVTLFLHSVHANTSNGAPSAAPPAKSPTPRAAPPRGAAPIAAPAAAGRVGHKLAGTTVLVVDDDMRNAFALSKVLRGHGLKVLIAQDGQKALQQLDSRADIDIVLMDIMMPGMDGYQTIRELRQRPRLRTLPVIALTAKAMVGDRDKCLEAGADDYLTKPVDVDRLLVAMQQVLKTLAAAHET